MDANIGKRFGRLTIIQFSKKVGVDKKYKCRCDCGNEKDVYISNLRGGRTLSCGCLNQEVILSVTKHGAKRTRLYRTWTNMKTRCSNPRTPYYKDYGARGINVCEEWANDFVAFQSWALTNGYNETLTIERINFNGNYEPSNCKWIEFKEQAANTRRTIFVTIGDETKNLKEWCRVMNLNYKTIHARVWTCGMSGIEALFFVR